MALEAVVFSQDLFGYTMKDLCSLGGGVWGYDFGLGLEKEEENQEGRGLVDGEDQAKLVRNFEEWDVISSSPETGGFPGGGDYGGSNAVAAAMVAAGRRKRRRTKKCKNEEEVENQRMTHIAVERNRRKQMNEYLALLRSLMPSSYVQRSDQASIVGGAINFVKELEQLLQSLEAQKRILQHESVSRADAGSTPLANFFTFPQYSSSSSSTMRTDEMVAENKCGGADVEVSMVDSHANLKVLMRRRPKQLLKVVVGLQNLRLTTLHLNVTTHDRMVLYSFSLKVEEGCQLTSGDEIAAAVYELVAKIQDA